MGFNVKPYQAYVAVTRERHYTHQLSKNVRCKLQSIISISVVNIFPNFHIQLLQILIPDFK